MPILPNLVKVASCEFDKLELDSKQIDQIMAGALSDYLKSVRGCNYYIRTLKTEFFKESTDPSSSWREIYDFTSRIHDSIPLVLSHILNKAGQRIGLSFKMIIRDIELKSLFETSTFHILPPPTEISVEEGIDIIVNNLRGLELREPSPIWEEKVEVPGLDKVTSEINQLDVDIEKLTDKRKVLETERDRLVKFRRLLWTKGETILQEAVKDAFIELGFTDIRQERAKNLEDWIFNFKLKPLIGVLEVTGADDRTSLRALRKCADWVTDYEEQGRDCKGIFMPNQYRREEYPKSKKKREHFEENEIRFAQKHNICILPTHILFNALCEKMRGDKGFNREFIEERILSADPVCTF